MRRPVVMAGRWLLGLAVGAAATWVFAVAPFPGVLVYVAAGLLLARTRRVAPRGAALFATGVWFAYLAYRTIASCDAINASGGICQMGDTTFQTFAALAFLAAGTLLSVYGFATDRP
ncbi:MAG TPA: hypothetical protein VFW12_02015 [Candidatus Limnocylindria bacterium]|nr:hypothetical protein [Candidatus Limnocylindria bacterium]